MTNRLRNRIRHSNLQLEPLPIERLGRARRELSMEISSSIDDETINNFRNDQLMEAIKRIEKEKRNLQLENLLYSRYLQRVGSSNIIETYEEYEDKSDAILTESRVVTNQTSIHAKLPGIARRLSVKRSSANPQRGTLLWSKLVTNWREYIYTPLLLRVEKEKLSIAAYEIEQTQLDWERMKINAQLTLDHLDDLLRASESDEIAQENLIIDFNKNINKLREKFKEEKFNNSRLIIPGEPVINRIKKRIQSNITSIGLLNINTTHTQLRMRTIDATIHTLDDLRDKMNEIDTNFVRTRKIDYFDTYEKLNRKYKLEKSSQYPLFIRLQKWKKILLEQEQEKIDSEYKYELLKNLLERLNYEINSLNNEHNLILNENIFLKNRIINIKKVPTITDYAHIIEQNKKLQHEIHIWTKRLNIAQTLLLQLKRQTKSPSVFQSLALPNV